MTSGARILVAEDDAVVARDIRETLGGLGYEVVAVTSSGTQAVEAARSERPDLALMDVRMSGELDGIEAGRRIWESHGIPVVYVTAYGDDKTLGRAVDLGSFGYVLKPFDDRDLKAAIEVGLYRSWMERRLRASEERFACTLRCIGEAVVATDATGRVTFMNEEARRLTGWSEAEALGHGVAQVVRLRKGGPEGPPLSPVERALGQRRPVRVDPEAVLVGIDGRTYPISDTAAPIITEDETMLGAVLVVRDETEARERERTLSWTEQRFRRLFEQDVTGHLVLGPEGSLREINPALLDMLGFDSLEGARRGFGERLARHTVDELVSRVREHGKVERLDLGLETGEGRSVEVFGSLAGVFDGGELVEVHGHFIDVTERRRLRAQLQQAQKMDAVGRLAGGIAHDFNNILTTIQGYADLLLGRNDLDHEVLQDLEDIQDAADRAASLTRQLLTFSRTDVVAPELLSPNELIREMIRMLSRLVGEDVKLRADLDPDVPPIRVDPSRFQQVVLNLVVNARDAMPGGGTASIRTFEVDPGETEDEAVWEDDPPERAVALEVSDTGTGMSPGELEHVFEPFYTTKAEGTGLGLATIWGIARQAGGTVTVSSRKGEGTRFTVLLPAAVPERSP